MFGRLIYNSIINYFIINKLFTPFRSDLLPGDSCMTEILSIIHEIQIISDKNLTVDVSGAFLDICKAFDKDWLYALLFKLKIYSAISELHSRLKSYLKNRKQRFLLNCQTSE